MTRRSYPAGAITNKNNGITDRNFIIPATSFLPVDRLILAGQPLHFCVPVHSFLIMTNGKKLTKMIPRNNYI
jgi:hypothetical protein